MPEKEVAATRFFAAVECNVKCTIPSLTFDHLQEGKTH